jgi:8-oxo-dGTP diphosphatase
VLVEAGLEVAPSYLEQLRTYGSPYRHPRVRAFSTAYIAVTPDHPVPDSGGARFFTVADLASHQGPQLVFDHSEIVHDALERLRGKVEWEGRLAAPFVAEPFSIPDLRRVYEAVWGGPVHRGDFRRKVLSVDGFLVPTGEHDTGTGGPPADLYRLGRATQFRPPMARRAMLLTKRAEEV